MKEIRIHARAHEPNPAILNQDSSGFLPKEGSTGAASSRARAIFKAGNPRKPNDLQKSTIDPVLTPQVRAKSEIDWVMSCSGSLRIPSVTRRCARFRVGNIPRSKGNTFGACPRTARSRIASLSAGSAFCFAAS